MINQVGNILINKFATLPFVDKYAGVVKTLSFMMPKGETTVKKMFPAACSTTIEECESGQYKDLIPDSSKKSVMYLEDKGMRFIKREGGNLYWRGTYDLVCWLNMKKLGFTDCSYSAIAITSIIAKVPLTPFNDGIYQRISIMPISQGSKQVNPFQKYSYDETVTQYLMYPFDYFVLTLEVDFIINQKCLEIPALNPPINC